MCPPWFQLWIHRQQRALDHGLCPPDSRMGAERLCPPWLDLCHTSLGSQGKASFSRAIQTAEREELDLSRHTE